MVESENSVHLKETNTAYIPASDAGRIFGYTSDYVARLAREKRVVGKRIGRQWFVDPQSLSSFVSGVSKQKILRSEAIRRERKEERTGERTDLFSPAPLVDQLKVASYQIATIDSLAMRVRALLAALGVVLAGGMIGFIIYTKPIDDVLRRLRLLPQKPSHLMLHTIRLKTLRALHMQRRARCIAALCVSQLPSPDIKWHKHRAVSGTTCGAMSPRCSDF